MSTTKTENPLFQCQKCNRLVPPIKRPSIAGVWFLSLIYLVYYYFFKKSECVYCGYHFKRSDLKSELEKTKGVLVE